MEYGQDGKNDPLFSAPGLVLEQEHPRVHETTSLHVSMSRITLRLVWTSRDLCGVGTNFLLEVCFTFAEFSQAD